MPGTVQPILFREEELPARPLHKPGAARDRLKAALDKMRAAASWPWKASTVAHYRESVWPALLGKLPDTDEASAIRAGLEAEAARLDAA